MRSFRDAQLDVSKVVTAVVAAAAPACAAAGQFGTSSGSMMDEGPHAEMRLAAETERLTPGDQDIAVVFTIDDGWHLYWENPGETGLAPSVKFTFPEGVELAGPLRWPAPERYVHGGGEILDYIYEDEVALLVPVRVSESLVGSEIEISANGFWLVCKEACIPGDGDASLRIAVGETGGKATSDAGVIAASRERVPSENIALALSWDGLTLVAHVDGAESMEYFPLEPDVGGATGLIEDGAVVGDRLRVRFDARVRNAERVRAVVGAASGGAERFFTVTLPPPRPRE